MKLFTFLLLFISAVAFGQQGVSIGSSGAAPDPSAILDLNATNKGFLMPRISKAQRDAISQPAMGLMIFDTTTKCFEFYTGDFWQSALCSCLGPPAQPGNISGLSNYCTGQSNLVYSIAPVATATSYVWSVPPDATIVSGQGTTSITVNFGSSTGYNISVYAINTCGNGTSRSLPLNVVGSLPPAPGAIGGIAYALNNQTGVTFNIEAKPNTDYYNWTVPAGATVATGQGTNSVTINFGTSSGTICVSDSNGCGSTSANCVNVSVTNSCPPNSSATFIYTGSPQTFTIPSCVSQITISAYGAQGGNGNSSTGGAGAFMQGTFSVTPGDVLTIGVGQHPDNNGNSGGGGGSSGVRDNGSLLIVAGGGGGGGNGNTNFSISNAVTGTSGQNTYGCGGGTLIASGGTGGNGGGGGTNPCGDWPQAGGGAGVNSNGAGANNGGNGVVGGGSSTGAGGNGTSYGSAGGYGLTGGGGASYAGGGGGGYSGGAGGSSSGGYITGGGGGSYNAGSSQTNTGGYQTGNGYVVITW